MAIRREVWRAISTDSEFRSCKSKRVYTSKAKADDAATKLETDTGKWARSYRCPLAPIPHWHISTHAAKPGRAA